MNARNVLRALLLCAAAFSVPLSAAEAPLKIGIVGTGSIGKNHARILAELPECEFTAIYDTNAETARDLAEHYGAKACATLEEFAALVDAATIATPTPTHFAVAKFLLR